MSWVIEVSKVISSMKHQIFMDGVFITEKTLTNTWPTFNNFIIGAANTSCCGD
jgi:hypothetical protein